MPFPGPKRRRRQLSYVNDFCTACPQCAWNEYISNMSARNEQTIERQRGFETSLRYMKAWIDQLDPTQQRCVE